MKSEQQKNAPVHLAYFLPESMARELINQLDIKLLVAGYAKNNENLQDFHPFRADPFFRFYYVTEGSVELIDIGGSTMLTPGHMYLIPAQQPFRYVYQGKFSHYWFHFCSSLLEKLPFFHHPIEIHTIDMIENMMNEMLILTQQQPSIRQLMDLDIIVRQVLLPFLEQMPENEPDQMQRLSRFAPVIAYINKHLNQDIAIPRLATMLSLNRNAFSAEFRRTFGIPPKQYICQNRINRAKELLLNSNMTVKEISEAVGYDNEFFFYRLFKKYCDATPTEFRQKSNLGV